MKNRIKQIRLYENMNQAEFGLRLGVTAAAISKIESGKIQPSTQTILSICREFDISEAWLKTGEGDMHNKKTRLEELTAFMGDVAATDDFRQRFIFALSRLNTDEWDMLSKLAEKLTEEIKKPED